jgi:ribosome-associated toxin RatA of RatAB toxin-antitoxin module
MNRSRFVIVATAMLGATAGSAMGPADAPVVAIQDNSGAYTVSARFSVAESAAVVHAVLTDYEGIPRFMPGVRTSRVVERQEGRARVAQEAVSKFLMFSKRVHLLLDVVEGVGTISFRDVSGTSFRSYEGSWTVARDGDWTAVDYRLTATPAFDIPGFVLRRLLDRDARAMIDGLRSEMANRGTAAR